MQFCETSLEKTRLSPVYRGRLSKGLEHLRFWLSAHEKGIHPWMLSDVGLNSVLAKYVNSCRTTGVCLWVPKHAILAIQTWAPQYRGKLHRPWDCIRNWKSILFLGSRPPLQEEILFGLFGFGLNSGFSNASRAHHWIVFAVLVRVGFHGLLRPGEFLGLRGRDVLFNYDRAKDIWVAVVAIVNPKTQNYMGRRQFTTLEDQGTVAWLRWLCLDLPGEYKLWPGSRHTFVQCWAQALEALGLISHKFTLGSLRAGGATFLYIQGMEIARIKFRGRWRSEGALACYIQEATSTLVWNQISSKAKDGLKTWQDQTAFCFDIPLSAPRRSVFSRRMQRTSGRKKPSKFLSKRRPFSSTSLPRPTSSPELP